MPDASSQYAYSYSYIRTYTYTSWHTRITSFTVYFHFSILRIQFWHAPHTGNIPPGSTSLALLLTEFASVSLSSGALLPASLQSLRSSVLSSVGCGGMVLREGSRDAWVFVFYMH